MPYRSISNAQIGSGRVIIADTMKDLRDNAHVGKASRVQVFTISGTWIAPSYGHDAKVTLIAGGGYGFTSQDFIQVHQAGGWGGGGYVWTPITAGQSYAVVVGGPGRTPPLALLPRPRQAAPCKIWVML